MEELYEKQHMQQGSSPARTHCIGDIHVGRDGRHSVRQHCGSHRALQASML